MLCLHDKCCFCVAAESNGGSLYEWKNCPGLIGKTALVTFPMSYLSKTNKQETKHKHES